MSLKYIPYPVLTPSHHVRFRPSAVLCQPCQCNLEVHSNLYLQLGKDVWEYDYTGLPKDAHTRDKPYGQRERVSGRNVDPNCVNGHRKEVVTQNSWLGNDTCEQADRAVDTLTSELKVAEAASLKCFQLRICGEQDD